MKLWPNHPRAYPAALARKAEKAAFSVNPSVGIALDGKTGRSLRLKDDGRYEFRVSSRSLDESERAVYWSPGEDEGTFLERVRCLARLVLGRLHPGVEA